MFSLNNNMRQYLNMLAHLRRNLEMTTTQGLKVLLNNIVFKLFLSFYFLIFNISMTFSIMHGTMLFSLTKSTPGTLKYVYIFLNNELIFINQHSNLKLYFFFARLILSINLSSYLFRQSRTKWPAIFSL